MNQRERSPQNYIPPPRWQTCTACGAMWCSHLETTCWACGQDGKPSRKPTITSQYGFAPPTWED